MARATITPTGVEQYFGEDEIIVSKTDTKGRITYANDIFLQIAGYTEAEVIGQPHSMIRHPDMPRAVFKLLWETVESGQELFAYVKNMCKNGDHYWVYAHVTPTFDNQGRIVGFHSSRRVPERRGVEKMQVIYRALREEERRFSDDRKGLEASYQLLLKTLEGTGFSYSEFIWSAAA